MSDSRGEGRSRGATDGRFDVVLSLIEAIYAGSLDPDAWPRFVADLSAAFDGAAVVISLRLPRVAHSRRLYSIGIEPAYEASYMRSFVGGVPWQLSYGRRLARRFVRLDRLFGDLDLIDTPYYREWMAPQGLPPVWPLGHAMGVAEARASAAVGIFRRAGRDPFRPSEVRLANRLVPHLSRAYRLFATVGGVRREGLALAEVMDRLSNGILLLDERGRRVVANRSANRLLGAHDGLRLDDYGTLRAWQSRDDERLGRLLEAGTRRRGRSSGLISVARPSGRPPLTAYVAPLLGGPSDRRERDATAVVYLSDPEGGQDGAASVLKEVYGLTTAEAELVQLLVQGCDLEAAARARSVSRNTVKTQLREVFQKTSTHRQRDLVRLVLSAVPGGLP